jgi:hypothetical protein
MGLTERGRRDRHGDGRSDRGPGGDGRRRRWHPGRSWHRRGHARRPSGPGGIRSGDVIRSFGRAPTPDTESLTEALAGARPGQTVTLTIARDDQTLRIGVRLGELPGG